MPRAPAQAILIDDFEDGDTQTGPATNNGWWYTTNDLSGVQTVTVGAPPGEGNPSGFALRSSGSGFTRWGALVGVNLSDDGIEDGTPIDLSGHVALRIRVYRASATGGVATAMIIMDDGDRFLTEIELPESWETLTLPFEQFRDDGRPFDFGYATHVQFTWSAPADFDVWFDDVELIAQGEL